MQTRNASTLERDRRRGTVLMALSAARWPFPPRRRIERAYVDARPGAAFYGDGQDVFVPQSEVSLKEALQVTPDGETVGWLVEEPILARNTRFRRRL